MSRSPFYRPSGLTGADPFWDMFQDRFFDTQFGGNLTEDDFFPVSMVPSYFFRRRTLGAPRSPLIPHSPSAGLGPEPHPLAAQQSAQNQTGPVATTTPSHDPTKYQIMVDVSHFTPEEITVKTVDNTIVVVGKHEDKADNYGYVSRQFSRKYLLPADVDPETVTSTLSADGILSIQAPRKPLQIKDTDGRAVPIAISNQVISPLANLTAPQFPVPQAQPSATGGGTTIPVQKGPDGPTEANSS